MTREDLMRKAIELSKENVENGGGPFGAVIATKEGEIVATGVNRVTASCDPTAHAEVSAIRAAAANSVLLILADTKSILPANLVPCVSVRFTGRDWIKCTMETIRPMPRILASTTLLSMTNWN